MLSPTAFLSIFIYIYIYIYADYSNINLVFPELLNRNLPTRHLWFGTCPRNPPGTCRSEPAREPSRNLTFEACPGTFREPCPGTLPGTCPGTLPGTSPSEPAPEPHVRNLTRNLSFGTCPGTLPGTSPSEPAPEPHVRNLPRNRPGTLPQNLTRTSPSEPAPEPSRNLPEPAPQKPHQKRPGAYIGKDPIAKAVGEKSVLI